LDSSRSSSGGAIPPAPARGFAALVVALGNLVFRYRDYMAPVAIALVALGSAPRPFLGQRGLDPRWDAAGLAVSLTGQTLRVLVIGLAYIKRGGKKKRIAADRLVVEGVFAHARHPLYTGNFLLLTGLMMIWNSPLGYTVTALLAFGLFSMACAEETFLRGKFGHEYDAYSASVPRFVPRLRGLGATASRFTFDWKRVMRKEYGTTFSWTTAALAFLALERVHWDDLHAATPALCVLAAVWLVIALLWMTARRLKQSRRLVSPD
jgi:protein-S-isoprenylcysteine O-methyltransferase Ste14